MANDGLASSLGTDWLSRRAIEGERVPSEHRSCRRDRLLMIVGGNRKNRDPWGAGGMAGTVSRSRLTLRKARQSAIAASKASSPPSLWKGLPLNTTRHARRLGDRNGTEQVSKKRRLSVCTCTRTKPGGPPKRRIHSRSRCGARRAPRHGKRRSTAHPVMRAPS